MEATVPDGGLVLPDERYPAEFYACQLTGTEVYALNPLARDLSRAQQLDPEQWPRRPDDNRPIYHTPIPEDGLSDGLRVVWLAAMGWAYGTVRRDPDGGWTVVSDSGKLEGTLTYEPEPRRCYVCSLVIDVAALARVNFT